MPATVTDPELAAVRAAHEAGTAFTEHGRFRFTVHSDTTDRTYVLWAYTTRGLLGVSCDCPAGSHRHGLVPCKHATRVCLLLEREGLAYRTEKGWVPAPAVLNEAWRAGSFFRPLDCCARCGKPIDAYAERPEHVGVDFEGDRYHAGCSWILGARRALGGES